MSSKQPDQHGTRKRYEKGCRCDACRAKAVDAVNRYRARKSLSKDYRHGTYTAYQCGCRCDACKQRKSTRKAVPFPHGTTAGAKRGCKCDPCREAKRTREREYKRERYANNAAFQQWVKDYASRTSKTPHARALARARVAKRSALMTPTIANDLDTIKLIYKHCPPGYTVDHIMPVAKGGAHAPENLQYLTGSINSRKRDRTDFDCSAHALRWQDVVVASSTAIPKGSTGKRPEAPNNPTG